MDRYAKNIGSLISAKTHKALRDTSVAIIGVGGNGGYIAEFVARLGVKKLMLFDGDVFETSNLNRQLFSHTGNIGCVKVQETWLSLQDINPDVEYLCADSYLEDNTEWLIKERPDFIFWCADGYPGGDLAKARAAVKDCLLRGTVVIESCLFYDEAACMVIDNDHVEWFDERTAMWIDNRSKRNNEQDWPSQPAYMCALSAALAVNEMIKAIRLEYYPAFGQAILFNAQEAKVHRLDSDYGQLY